MAFFDVLDPVFATYVLGNAPVKRLATGFDWVEGPVWFGDHGCLLFSDIPNNRILRWSDADGLTTFRAPSNYANGHTRDREGRLVSCEHGTRRVTRTECDGTVTVIADRHDGKTLNSPNDVIVARDGAIWFSDPHYGIMTDYEGFRAQQEQPCAVYRVDPTGRIEAVITDMACPNGLAFSPDESRLYVADTGRMFQPDPQHIRVYDMVDGRPVDGRLFFKIDARRRRRYPGGQRRQPLVLGRGRRALRRAGRAASGPDPRAGTVSNICFGGRAKNRLFITATTSIYSVILNRRGVQWP